MKKLMALVLAMMLVMSATGVMAAEMPEKMETKMTVTVNKDLASGILYMMLMGSGEGETTPSPELINAVIDMVNKGSIYVVNDSQNVNMEVRVNEMPIATMQEKIGEDGSLMILTDLLPSYVLAADAQEMGTVATIDPAKMAAAEEKLMAGLKQAAEEEFSAVTVTEVGSEDCEFAYGDVVFNHVTIKDVDSYGAARALMNMLEKTLGLMETYMQECGMNMEGMDIASARQPLTEMEMTEEEFAGSTVTLKEYRIKEGDGFKEGYLYQEFCISEEGLTINLSIATQEKACDVFFGMMDGENKTVEEMVMAANMGQENAVAMELSVIPGETEEEGKFSVQMITGGMMMGMAVDSKAADNGYDAVVDLYMLTDEAPMVTLNISTRPYEGEVPAVDITGKTVVNLLDSEALNSEALNLELQQSGNMMLVKLIQAAPVEMQLVLDEITAMQQPAVAPAE